MAKIESLVPVNGVGFVTNNRTDNSHFATQVVHDLLIKIAGCGTNCNPITLSRLARFRIGAVEISRRTSSTSLASRLTCGPLAKTVKIFTLLLAARSIAAI